MANKFTIFKFFKSQALLKSIRTQTTLAIFLGLSVIFSQPTKYEVSTVRTEVKNTQNQVVLAKKIDKQADILAKYLAQFDSPLQYHAQDFIDAAKTYNLDYRLLPAIAGVESTFGKQIPGGFNAWGWGVYGTQAIYFNSWREGIFTIAKGLRENYLNRGYTEPYSINKIYAASPFWGGRVSYFMQDLDQFAKKEEAQNSNKVTLNQLPSTKIAASSGLLASNRN